METDFSLHSVPFSDIRGGGPPRDGIPPIDDPKFTDIKGGDGFLADKEPVVALEINGDATAYPLQILIWHEIVNDEVGDVPVAVTFCPHVQRRHSVRSSAGRRVVRLRYLGQPAKQRPGDVGPADRVLVAAIHRRGHRWDPDWEAANLHSGVHHLLGGLQERQPLGQGPLPGHGVPRTAPTGRNPYSGYDRADNPPFLYSGELDDRLQPKERVVAVTMGGIDLAFPFQVLEREKVVNYSVDGEDLAVFFKLGTLSALDRRDIEDSKDVGATGVFDPQLGDMKLTFRAEGDSIVDKETGSVWNILGEAVQGPLAGSTLTPIVHANHFWFALAAFQPDARIYRGSQ